MNQVIERCQTSAAAVKDSVSHATIQQIHFEVALRKLRDVANRCPTCAGTGETRELYEVYFMNEDPRLFLGHWACMRRARLKRQGARPEDEPRAAAWLRTPCTACADIRATLRTCEAM